MSRTLIQAHTVITGSGAQGEISRGAVVVEDGLIREVGDADTLLGLGGYERVIGDPDEHVAMPGLVNAHYHGLRPYRLRTLKSPLEMVLAQSRRRRLPALTNEELHDHSLWTAVRLLQTGVTSFVDCFPTDPQLEDLGIAASLDSYLRSGIRVALCVRCSDRSTFTYEDDEAFVRRLPEPLRSEVEGRRRTFDAAAFFEVCESISRTYDGREGRVRVGIGPTGPAWCSDELLGQVRRFADDRGAPVQIHLLESPYQAVAAAERYGETAVAHLARLGLVREHVSFAHSIWLTAEDRSRISDGGSALIHCPGSNLSAGDGVANVPELLADGCRVGIGLDSSGFEETADMFREMRLALLVNRRAGWNRSPLTETEIMGAATHGATHALMLPTQTGTLEPGMGADVVLLSRRSLLSSPYSDPEQPAQELVVEAGSRDGVDVVLVGGRVVIEDGEPVGVDMASLEGRVRDSVARYLPLLLPADTQFKSLEPFIDAYYRDIDLASAGIDTRAHSVDEEQLLAYRRSPVH